MSQKKWITLDPETLNRTQRKDVDGIEITLGMSPFDLPDKVSGEYRDEIKKFVITFQYLGVTNEPLRPLRSVEPHILFRVGAHSGRLCEIQVDVAAAAADHVRLDMIVPEVESAIGALGDQVPNRRDNFSVAREVITENKSQLIEGVFAGD
ncbi:hypothetical protein Mal52_11650 [Symmachiella dynata]|uniref:Uncharacterized protein n=1 Tax=Symmachiella dynata TaxID=2527995 RepID=A0A517ZJP5_9PLAN|nr:hypothetical protein [Symmachiella dynata]QDU42698.1 hypothetical protein Mal52_11650 [Symmachiella dynata]